MNARTGNNWIRSFRAAFFGFGHARHRVKPKRHDKLHNMHFLDASELDRDVGHR